MAHAIEYRRLRAPREHGQTLIDPPLHTVAELIAQNQSAAQTAYGGVSIGELSLAELRDSARKELFAAALSYTRATLGECEAETKGTFILAGHQPELFHPGVWLKNFVLSSLGRQHNATAINLIVDNDNAGQPSIRVPHIVDGKAVADAVSFDDPLSERAYEERPVLNERLFTEFAKLIDPRGDRLVTPLWQKMDRAQQNLGLRLAGARHRLEHAHGLRTLEVPLSTVCEAPSFARFALHLLLELPRLREVYNDAITAYRRANHVRSEAHPVPQLSQQGQWLEAPLWIWSHEQPQRRQAFARVDGERLIVSDRGQLHVELPLVGGRIADATNAAWRAAAERGIKLRPRALVTTMYARLLLSDLFLHGIGGAKYDQLTDAIIERLFGLAPPHYLTVTGTFKLHPVNAVETAARLREAQHQLRELPYHPEAHLAAASAEVQLLMNEKRCMVSDPPPKGNRKAWHEGIVALNAKLLQIATPARERLTQERDQLAADLQLHALLGSREFSFCLFDESLIVQLTQLAKLAQVG